MAPIHIRDRVGVCPLHEWFLLFILSSLPALLSSLTLQRQFIVVQLDAEGRYAGGLPIPRSSGYSTEGNRHLQFQYPRGVTGVGLRMVLVLRGGLTAIWVSTLHG